MTITVKDGNSFWRGLDDLEYVNASNLINIFLNYLEEIDPNYTVPKIISAHKLFQSNCFTTLQSLRCTIFVERFREKLSG